MVFPSFTPGGIFTLMVRAFLSCPAPRQPAQGESIIRPDPPHCRHGFVKEKKPWLEAHRPRTAASSANVDLGAGLGAVAAAPSAPHVAVYGHRGGGALDRLLEGQIERGW